MDATVISQTPSADICVRALCDRDDPQPLARSAALSRATNLPVLLSSRQNASMRRP
jgi:hypothetical protein